jgi:4-carboxymuconolactone decarboxylase
MIGPRIDLDAVRKRIGAYADRLHGAEERGDIYRQLLGFVPPRIEAR